MQTNDKPQTQNGGDLSGGRAGREQDKKGSIKDSEYIHNVSFSGWEVYRAVHYVTF